MKPLAILFGAAFTIATAISLGRLLIRRLRLTLYRDEEWTLGFVLGSACLSALMFALCALHLVYKPVLLGVCAGAIGLAAWTGALRPGKAFPPLPKWQRALLWAVIAVFGVLYFFNAMAPEFSPDGSGYHLGVVTRYLHEHGFLRITWHMYANLSHGMEMLFLPAFAFGRHSAAAMVHCAFLFALPALLLAWGRRFGHPLAGLCGGLLAFASPIAGVDGISAYNDVALAAVVFALFYLLQLWDQDRAPTWLIPIGLLVGFCYAIKYTAFVAVPYAAGFLIWKSARKGHPWFRPLVTVGLAAAVMMVPWMVKNWVVVRNPFSPFLNAVFPNPYITVSFEQEYSASMRTYDFIHNYWQLPLEVTVHGRLAGLFGPLFLLAPIALLALRWHMGRQLLLAAAVFGSTYFANIGARFLIPVMPFVAGAIGMAIASVPALAAAVALAHAVLSCPAVIPRYAHPWAWRLERIPFREALRIDPEEVFLGKKMPGFKVARMVEAKTPPGSLIFSPSNVPESYCSREVLTGYYSAFTNVITEILQTPLIPERAGGDLLRFRFPAQPLRKLRVVQTASGGPDHWSVTELRIYSKGKELAREPRWRLRAYPNRWGVQLAFDNSAVTRWQSWHILFPGMFLEVDLGWPETADMVALEASRDQYKIRLRLEGQGPDGKWIPLAGEPEQSDAPPALGLRRAATEVVKANGVGYLLYFDHDFGADDIRRNRDAWGLTLVGEESGARLYRID